MSEMNVTTMEEMKAARDKAHEDFVVDRALYEKQFNDWYAKFMQCTKLHEEVPFDFKGWTIQTLVPELYEANPREDVANQQMDELEAKVNQINEIAHKYNLMAHQKHLELVALRQQQNS